MKHRDFFSIFFLTVFVSFLSINSAFCAGDLKARILFVEGDVQVKASPAADWKKAEEGMELEQGGQIVTSAQSSCELAVGAKQQSAIKLNPGTRTTLSSIEPPHINLESGKLFALVRGLSKGSAFQVSSPTAVASARGTGFSQDPGAVDVFDDQVFVKGNAGGNEEGVGQGNGIHVNPDGTLGGSYDLSKDQISQWDEFKEDVEQELGDQEELEGQDGDETNDEDLAEAKDESVESEDQQEINDQLEPEEEDLGRGTKGGY